MEGPTAPAHQDSVTTANQRSGHSTAPRDSIPRAPSPPSALLPLGLFSTRQMIPFALDNAATSLARTICPGASMCVERPLALPRSMEMRQEALQVAECLGLPQIRRPRCLGLGCYTLTTLRQQLVEEGHGCFYTTKPDPDFEFDSCDPMRECFNVDRAMATTDDMEDTAATVRASVAGENPRTPGNDGQVDPPPQDYRAAQLAQLCELKAKLDKRPSMPQPTRAGPRARPTAPAWWGRALTRSRRVPPDYWASRA